MKKAITMMITLCIVLIGIYSIMQVLKFNENEKNNINERIMSHDHKMNGKSLAGLKLKTEGSINKDGILGDYLDHDINVINVWASWCEPCNKEMPELVQFHKHNEDIGLIGLNINDKSKDRENFIKEHGVDFEVLVAKDEMIRKYKIYNIPTTFFTDKKGKVLKTYVGELDENKLKQITESLKK